MNKVMNKKIYLLFIVIIIGLLILICNANAHAIVVTDGLVSWWKFDETDGTTAEDSQGAHDGTLYNFPSPPTWTTDTAGIGSSGSLEFDGSDDYVGLADSSDWDFGSEDFTLEAWVKSSATSGDRVIINNWDYFNNNRSWCLYLSNTHSQKVWFQLDTTGDLGGNVEILSNSSLNDNLWHHVVATREGDNLYLYVDGVKQTDTDTISGALYSKNYCAIGRWAKTDLGYFDGLIDEVRVYSKALSLDEVQQNYAAMTATIPEPSALLLLGMGLSGLLTFSRRN